MKGFLFSLLFFLFLFTACTNDDDFHEIIQLKYGTSFGMCVGYCKNEMALKPDLIIYRKEGWNASFQAVECSETLINEAWNSIVEFNHLEAFFELPKIIGCPDCADGGAEWVEMKLKNGEKHKVVFEYFNEPGVLKDYIDVLRNQMDKAQSCEGF